MTLAPKTLRTLLRTYGHRKMLVRDVRTDQLWYCLGLVPGTMVRDRVVMYRVEDPNPSAEEFGADEARWSEFNRAGVRLV